MRPDPEICRDIIDGVLCQSMALDPLTVQVSVSHGEVELTGEVDQKTTARMAICLTALVPGVVTVHNRLSCPSH
jgi:osmotically-inducible protein OsmY